MWKNSYRVAVLTASDSAAAGTRADESGPLLTRLLQQQGALLAETAILPDDKDQLAAKLQSWSDSGIQLILTTGGTGLSARDCMPEATLAVAERLVPGIAQGIRAHSMQYTNRAMLSRGVAVVRGSTLIINLPGSPKAVAEAMECVLPVLEHALDTLCGNSAQCARV